MVFGELAETIGKPPMTLFDLRPLQYPMLLVTDHEIAEQISRASKAHPYSTPKSPTMGALHPIVGPSSMIITNVSEASTLRLRLPIADKHETHAI